MFPTSRQVTEAIAQVLFRIILAIILFAPLVAVYYWLTPSWHWLTHEATVWEVVWLMIRASFFVSLIEWGAIICVAAVYRQ